MLSKKDYFQSLTATHRSNVHKALSEAAHPEIAQAKTTGKREANRQLTNYIEEVMTANKENKGSKKNSRPAAPSSNTSSPANSPETDDQDKTSETDEKSEKDKLPKRKGKSNYTAAIGEYFRSTASAASATGRATGRATAAVNSSNEGDQGDQGDEEAEAAAIKKHTVSTQAYRNSMSAKSNTLLT